MKNSRKLLMVLAIFVFAIVGTVFMNMGYANTLACSVGIETASSCGRCGDGFCNPSCGENKINCPKDCKPSPY